MSYILKVALIALLIGPSVTARAQGTGDNPATALKSSCRTDYRAHCTGNDPAPPIAAACLAQFYVNLSKGCKEALDAYNAPPAEATPDD